MKRYIHQDIYAMSRVGYVDDFEIYVNTNDGGNIPHFHLRDQNEWDAFHTCIKIESPEYFLHGVKQDVLNASQKRELDKFMRSKVSIKKYEGKFANNWELVCFLWDMNNSNVSISDDAVQPDYTELN